MPPTGVSVGRLNLVIASFCAEIAAEPMSFFSEADLQGMLFAKLTAEFPDHAPTGVARGPNSKSRYATGVVHREYGAGGGRRIDISLFDPKDIAMIDGPKLMIGNRYLKPRFAIELGTEKTSETAKHIRSDLSKLSLATERGYLIHIFRDITQADTGTRSREGTERRLSKTFRDPVLSAHVLIPPTVIALFLLLRLARSRRRIRGKCEIFTPKTGKWEKLNLRQVRGKVLGHLS